MRAYASASAPFQPSRVSASTMEKGAGDGEEEGGSARCMDWDLERCEKRAGENAS